MAEKQYGAKHQQRRRELEPKAYGTVCPICSKLMLKGQSLDLNHSTPFAEDPTSVGDEMVHARCNRQEGGRLGNRRRNLSPSRQW